MNQTRVRQHAPHLARANTPIGTVDDGSGIQLGQSVGAHAIHMNEGFVTLPWYPPESLIKGIFINEQDTRFINDACYHGRTAQIILQQPGTSAEETSGGKERLCRCRLRGSPCQEKKKTNHNT